MVLWMKHAALLLLLLLLQALPHWRRQKWRQSTSVTLPLPELTDVQRVCLCVCVLPSCTQHTHLFAHASVCQGFALLKSHVKLFYPECLGAGRVLFHICSGCAFTSLRSAQRFCAFSTCMCVHTCERHSCAQCLLKVKLDSLDIFFRPHSALFRVHRADIHSLRRCFYLHLHLQWIFVLPGLINSSCIVYYVRGHCVFLLWPELWENERLDQETSRRLQHVSFLLSVTCRASTFANCFHVLMLKLCFISVNCVPVRGLLSVRRCSFNNVTVVNIVSSKLPHDHTVIMF